MYSVIDEFMAKNENRILKLAKDRMMRGDGVNGGIIGSYASRDYELFKQSENPLAGGVVDLFLTGSLQKYMLIERIRNGVYEISSSDLKYDALADKYGADQFGLTEEQNEEIINEALDYLVLKIRQNYE